MAKQKTIEIPSDAGADMRGVTSATRVPDSASGLIYQLVEFYNKNPDYQTPVLDIYTLTRLAHAEMAKFIRRPHTRVTKVYFDSEVPDFFKA